MRLTPTPNLYRDTLKLPRIPDGFILLQDTREQHPLCFEDSKCPIIITTLKNGDYSIKGFESKFSIERKQISDFYSYIGKERDKTTQKMEKFKGMEWVGLVVEASEADLLTGFIMSKVSPETARQALVSFEVRYGIHVYYSRSREDIARWVLDRAIKFYKIQREAR